MALLPIRPADNSLVLDTNKFMARTYTSDGGVKIVKRKDGKLERQYRLNIGRLPVAYRSEPEGHILYVLDSALSVMSNDSDVSGRDARPPVPPCILPAGSKVQVGAHAKAACSFIEHQACWYGFAAAIF
eukprot:scaffold647910_cov38-Prasinocladus_malaysianus.AAC.1